jgi:hypothetical protein
MAESPGKVNDTMRAPPILTNPRRVSFGIMFESTERSVFVSMMVTLSGGNGIGRPSTRAKQVV